MPREQIKPQPVEKRSPPKTQTAPMIWLIVGIVVVTLGLFFGGILSDLPNNYSPANEITLTEFFAMTESPVQPKALIEKTEMTPTIEIPISGVGLTYVSPPVDSTATQRIIFKDDFQDFGVTSLNWLPLGGTWIVENGVLNCVANGKYLAKITTPEDFIFRLDIMGINVVDKIIVFRVIDESTHYGIDFRTAPYNDIVLVKSLPGNTGQIIQTVPFENYNNIWYTIKVDVANNHIKAFVNDQLTIDFIDVSSPITGGSVGVGAMLQAGFSVVYYDNIVVSPH